MSPTSILRGIAFLLLLQWVSTLIINALGVPFPPALLGMLILTGLLCAGIIPDTSVEGICNILISKMGMLFLPAGVSVILYADVIMAAYAHCSLHCFGQHRSFSCHGLLFTSHAEERRALKCFLIAYSTRPCSASA